MGASFIARKNYTITEEGWCQKFGTVQYITDLKQSTFQGIRITFEAKTVLQIYQQWEKIVTKLAAQEQIKNFIVLPNFFYWQKESHLCNYEKPTVSAYEVIYNRFFTTLSNELKLRIERKAYFTEVEIWYLGYILLKVGAFFERRQFHLGNIHPKNIIIDKEGMVRIFTIVSSPTERQNCQEVKESKYNDAFLAPEETSEIHHANIHQIINKNKVDAYYIGLVMLSLVSLKDLYFLFNHCESSIKLSVLDELLAKLKERDKYSIPLYLIIKGLLEYDPMYRRTPQEYYQLFEKYEEEILSMQQVEFSQSQIQELSCKKEKQVSKKKRNRKEITFLTLSKEYREQATRTKAKVSKFMGEEFDTNIKINHKPFQKLYQ